MDQVSEKSFSTTHILCVLLGVLGAHRFYVGKIGTGVLMLLTLGGIGMWIAFDAIQILKREVYGQRRQAHQKSVHVFFAPLFLPPIGGFFLVGSFLLEKVYGMCICKFFLCSVRTSAFLVDQRKIGSTLFHYPPV
jgi:TM2 domain-containing membrane protein YozV